MNKYSKFFDEIFSSVMVIGPSAMVKYLPYITAVRDGKVLALPEKPLLKMGFFDDLMNPIAPDKQENTEGVAVIPLQGVMTRSGSWWDYGTEDVASMLEDAFKNEAITSVVLRTNSPGGTVESIFPLKAAFMKKNKPVYGAVDSQGCSCAYYALSYCDKIFSVDDMASVGSIGVMANFYDYSKMYADIGIKLIEVVPPQSKWKNLPYREAQAGKPDLLISEELTPWALHFQETVKANRKNVDENVEGTLEGRVFFSNYGELNAMTNHLIDGVKSFDDIIQYAFNQSKNNKIKGLFN
jgi:protease-4